MGQILLVEVTATRRGCDRTSEDTVRWVMGGVRIGVQDSRV